MLLDGVPSTVPPTLVSGRLPPFRRSISLWTISTLHSRIWRCVCVGVCLKNKEMKIFVHPQSPISWGFWVEQLKGCIIANLSRQLLVVVFSVFCGLCRDNEWPAPGAWCFPLPPGREPQVQNSPRSTQKMIASKKLHDLQLQLSLPNSP